MCYFLSLNNHFHRLTTKNTRKKETFSDFQQIRYANAMKIVLFFWPDILTLIAMPILSFLFHLSAICIAVSLSVKEMVFKWFKDVTRTPLRSICTSGNTFECERERVCVCVNTGISNGCANKKKSHSLSFLVVLLLFFSLVRIVQRLKLTDLMELLIYILMNLILRTLNTVHKI